MRFSDGRPLLLTLADGQALPTYGQQRPNLSAPLQCNGGSLTNYFSNPDVLSAPAPFALGNAPRTDGSCRQPGQESVTLSAFKSFSLAAMREGSRLEFRMEAFNAFNHPYFNGPNTDVDSGNFGVITSTVGGTDRQVQLALKLYF